MFGRVNIGSYCIFNLIVVWFVECAERSWSNAFVTYEFAYDGRFLGRVSMVDLRQLSLNWLTG